MSSWINRSENKIRKYAIKKARGIALANLHAAITILKVNPQISQRDLLVETLKSRYRIFPISEEEKEILLKNSKDLPKLIMNIASYEITPHGIDDHTLGIISEGVVLGVQEAYKKVDKKLP